jgi:hypothetical protein
MVVGGEAICVITLNMSVYGLEEFTWLCNGWDSARKCHERLNPKSEEILYEN